MAIRDVVTRGYGTWGSIAEVVTRGYGIGAAVATVESPGLEFTVKDGRLHFAIQPDARLHFTLEND